jgi:hypothetical protein
MSVQKYIINKESNNFTIIPNKIINGLHSNLELLGFYLYLLSLPPNWSFHKNQLQSACNIGIKKLEKFLRLLSKCELIHISQQRTAKGQFSHFDLTVYNGERFNINGLQEISPCVKNRPTVNGSTVKNTYKRNIVEIKKEKREKARKKRVPLSDYHPSQELTLLLNETEERTGNKKILEKFKNKMKSTGIKSNNWDSELKIWLSRERPDNKNSIKDQNSTLKFYTDTKLSIEEAAKRDKKAFERLKLGINAHGGTDNDKNQSNANKTSTTSQELANSINPGDNIRRGNMRKATDYLLS